MPKKGLILRNFSALSKGLYAHSNAHHRTTPENGISHVIPESAREPADAAAAQKLELQVAPPERHRDLAVGHAHHERQAAEESHTEHMVEGGDLTKKSANETTFKKFQKKFPKNSQKISQEKLTRYRMRIGIFGEIFGNFLETFLELFW